MPENGYAEALKNFQRTIDDFHDLVHDGFKAPEQIVEATPELLNSIWSLQVEYAAMRRGSKHA